MSGASIASEVAAAYAEAGVEAGDGVGAVSVTISRPGAPGGDPWNPWPSVPTDYTFTAKPAEKQYMRLSGVAIEAGERVYSLVNHETEITPQTADTLTVDGEDWTIVDVVAQDYAGHTITWLVKVRR